MSDLLKSWEKNGFKVEFCPTYCGSVGYVVWDGEFEVFHNNNFYPSKKAYDNLKTDDLIIYELIKMLDEHHKKCSEYHRSFISEEKMKWYDSDRYQEFVNLIPTGTYN